MHTIQTVCDVCERVQSASREQKERGKEKMENINITLNDMDMNKNLAPEDITLDASTLTHLRNIMQARKILDKVWDRYNKVVCLKLNNESTKNITIVNRSWKTIDNQKLIELIGAEAVEELKTNVVEQHYISNL